MARISRWKQRQGVSGAAHSPVPLVQHVGVNHRLADVAVSEQLLDGADVVVVFQQMGREGMPKGVRRGVPGNAGFARGSPLKNDQIQARFASE